MKKLICMISVILLLCVAYTTILVSCNSKKPNEDDVSTLTSDVNQNEETVNTQADIQNNNTAETNNIEQPTTQQPVTQQPVTQQETTEQATTEQATTEESTANSNSFLGYTSKGFEVSVKDGITYVDGVLIANKTYALPENYNPGDLLSECYNAFYKMQSDASERGLNIYVASGFRSYELQNSLYTRYSNQDGKAAADRYSARPGHSEHQTGLAIDLNDITQAFANTDEGIWIAENCHRYGFILRYPKNKEDKTGYMYEPWHIRYVGERHATAIYESGLCLEEYFGISSSYDSKDNLYPAPNTQSTGTESFG